MTIHERLKAALANCSFPGMENWRWQIALHEGGHGLHQLRAYRLLPNGDHYTSRYEVKDIFGNIIEKGTRRPDDPMTIYNWEWFWYAEEYPDNFFEEMIFRIYATFEAHEAFESFKVKGKRMHDPHEDAWYVRPNGVLRHNEWRNDFIFYGISVAAQAAPPKLPLWAKAVLAEKKIREEVVAVPGYFKRWFGIMKHKGSDAEERVRATCMLINNLYFLVTRHIFPPTQWLEEWLTNRPKYIEKMEKKMAEQEAKEAA